MDPSAYKEHLHRPELEGLLEKIISGAAAIADSENTRDERKKRIVDECNNLRQALQDLLAEYEKNVSHLKLILFYSKEIKLNYRMLVRISSVKLMQISNFEVAIFFRISEVDV